MENMNIEVENFGITPSGLEVKLFSLCFEDIFKIKLINYGAKVVSIIIPDKNNIPTDIVLGYNSLSDYINGNRFFGSNPGPFANRIKGARFKIKDYEYRFEPNENGNLLHSGNSALESVVWNYEVGKDYVNFIYKSADAEFGFPGNKIFQIKYKINPDLSFQIEYIVKTDKATHINLTHHSYFNLEGEQSKSILDHFIKINSSKILEVDDELIPTGKYIDVKDTPLDLRSETKIGDRIFSKHEILQKTLGFDQCYVIENHNSEMTHCASVISKKNGCSMDIYSTMPGLQFYTDNYDNGEIKGKSGEIYPINCAFCLEPQFFPNTPNISEFPSTLVTPDKEFRHQINYCFNKIQNK